MSIDSYLNKVARYKLSYMFIATYKTEVAKCYEIKHFWNISITKKGKQKLKCVQKRDIAKTFDKTYEQITPDQVKNLTVYVDIYVAREKCILAIGMFPTARNPSESITIFERKTRE